MLFVVTGASGSGKSAIRPHVEALLPEHVWYEFDSVGVPADADTAWRQRVLADWMRRVVAEQGPTKRDVILSGQVAPGEVLASPPAPALDGLALCLLDCADDVRIRRLEGSGRDVHRDTLEWADWLRRHALDPRCRPEVIRDAGPGAAESDWSRWADWDAGDPRWSVHRIDTSFRTIPEVATEVVRWIQAVGPHRTNPVAHPAT